MYQVYQVYTLYKEYVCGKMSLMKKVTAKYARQNFAELINEVYFGKKKIMVTRSGKPVIVLSRVEEVEKKSS